VIHGALLLTLIKLLKALSLDLPMIAELFRRRGAKLGELILVGPVAAMST
jgi:hypothetical protein